MSVLSVVGVSEPAAGSHSDGRRNVLNRLWLEIEVSEADIQRTLIGDHRQRRHNDGGIAPTHGGPSGVREVSVCR
jgi:hypothetical protein